MSEVPYPNLKAKFIKILLELLSLGLLVLGLMLFLALASYNSQDPSWNYVTSNSPTNLIGITGAWLADLLFALAGLAAWLLPFSLGVLAWGIYSRPWLASNWQPFTPSLRLVGWLLTFSGVACALALSSLTTPLVFGAGGVLGTSLSQALQAAVGYLGACLVVILGVLAGLSLLSGWSWLVVSDELGFVFTGRLPRLINKLLAADKPATKSKKVTKALAVAAKSQSVKLEPQLNLSTTQAKPNLEVLDPLIAKSSSLEAEDLTSLATSLEVTLAEFGVQAKVVASHPGPVITQFEVKLAAGVKSAKVSGLAADLARNLKVASLRVIEVVAGKSTLGIEIPNSQRQTIQQIELINHPEFLQAAKPLPLTLGLDISGQPVIADLASMPHLLVAGTTGSGKSVGINSMLVSLLLAKSPQELKLLLLDPKMLELSVYEGIPHLLTPVITDMNQAATCLSWCVDEMERRYQLMATAGVRNLNSYNDLAKKTGQETLPYLVVVADEFADMVMLVGKETEQLIVRLAQKARAAGIHLILATQRPSVDVITGLIKANIPTRLAYQVASRIDSRIILDQGGAEQLLGKGDFLYLPPGSAVPYRLHGAFVTDAEVHRLVAAWKKIAPPNYLDEVLEGALNPADAE